MNKEEIIRKLNEKFKDNLPSEFNGKVWEDDFIDVISELIDQETKQLREENGGLKINLRIYKSICTIKSKQLDRKRKELEALKAKHKEDINLLHRMVEYFYSDALIDEGDYYDLMNDCKKFQQTHK